MGTTFEFRWGRTDATADNCDLMRAESRAPDFSSATGCEELEEKLVERMGMSWLEVVSLMGYHTLGSDENGHAWTDHTVKSFDFDNSYYRDLTTDGWVPRDENTGSWGWGGQISHPVVMYPKDLCLFYDLEGSETQCCTNGVNSNCQDANGNVLPACKQLPDGNDRKNAVLQFSTNEGDNINSQDFLTNFGTVFRHLSLNGWGLLFSPWQNSTEVYCRDTCHFDDSRPRQRECNWMLARPDPRCEAYGHLCPITCGNIGVQYFPEKCRYQNAPIDTGLACETIE